MHLEDLIVQKITEGKVLDLPCTNDLLTMLILCMHVVWSGLCWTGTNLLLIFTSKQVPQYCLIGAQLKWMNMQFLHL